MSLPTPKDFDPTPYDIEDEDDDDEAEGDCMFPEPDAAA
jgi:hypothetical protein